MFQNETGSVMSQCGSALNVMNLIKYIWPVREEINWYRLP